MRGPIDPIEQAREILTEWLEDPKSTDPFNLLSEVVEAMAQGFDRYGHHGEARVARDVRETLDALIELIGRVQIDYDTAARISPLSRGGLKNKRKQLLGGETCRRGMLPLSCVPLDGAHPGLHSQRAGSAMGAGGSKSKADQGEEEQDAEETQAQKWARQAMEKKRDAA